LIPKKVIFTNAFAVKDQIGPIADQEKMTRTCPKCGYRLKSAARNCPSCGNAVVKLGFRSFIISIILAVFLVVVMWQVVVRPSRVTGESSETSSEPVAQAATKPESEPIPEDTTGLEALNASAQAEDTQLGLRLATKAIESGELTGDDLARALYNRAHDLDNLGRYEEAVRDYNRAVELTPTWSELYNNRGLALRKLGREAEAMADFSKSLELAPDNAIVLYNRGSGHILAGDTDSAIGDFTHALEIMPNLPHALFNRALCWSQKGEHEKALKDYNRLLTLDPGYAKGYFYRSLVNEDLGRWNSALADAEKYSQLAPDDKDGFQRYKDLKVRRGKE
jgi:Tfp pilus assembly protein PilF